MADKQIKVCEVHVSIVEGEGIGCELDFTKAFIEMSDWCKKLVAHALCETMQSYKDEVVGGDIELLEEEVDQATEDASNFLDRCVKEHGGRLH